MSECHQKGFTSQQGSESIWVGWNVNGPDVYGGSSRSRREIGDRNCNHNRVGIDVSEVISSRTSTVKTMDGTDQDVPLRPLKTSGRYGKFSFPFKSSPLCPGERHLGTERRRKEQDTIVVQPHSVRCGVREESQDSILTPCSGETKT